MKELAKQFIGKAYLVYTIASSDITVGVIKEVDDGGIIVEIRPGEE